MNFETPMRKLVSKLVGSSLSPTSVKTVCSPLLTLSTRRTVSLSVSIALSSSLVRSSSLNIICTASLFDCHQGFLFGVPLHCLHLNGRMVANTLGIHSA